MSEPTPPVELPITPKAEIVRLPDFVTLQVPEIEFQQLDTFDKQKFASLRGKGVLDEIPEGGVLMDVGCGKGGVGMAVAAARKARFIQADIFDSRDPEYRFGELVKLPEESVFQFDGGKVDTILLNDVLQHVKPYEGMDGHQTRIAFLEGLLTALKPEGKIILSGDSQSGDFLRKDNYLQKLVEENEKFRDRVVIKL